MKEDTVNRGKLGVPWQNDITQLYRPGFDKLFQVPQFDMPAYYAYNVGMKKQAIDQYTIRGVPPHIDKALRRMAREEGKSMNQFLLRIIETAVSLADISFGGPAGSSSSTRAAGRFSDLDGLIGSWTEDRGFDEALRAQEQVDRDLWK